MKILLIRHGQSTGNVQGKFTGQTDVPLTQLGVTQGKLLCEYLMKNYTVDAVYTSKLLRAKDTVKSLVQTLNLAPIEDGRINELYMGKWENQVIKDLNDTCPNELHSWMQNQKNYHCPDGENFVELYCRAVDFITDLVKTDKNTVCVCSHGGVLRSILCYVKYGSVDYISEIDWGRNASITELDYNNGKFTVIKEFYDEFLLDNKSGYVGVL